MKKGIFKELVFIKVSGGRPSTDGSVQIEDIEAYIPACVNYALTKGYYIQIKEEQDRDIPSLFYTEFDGLAIVRDRNRNNRASFMLPVMPIPISSNRSIRNVIDDCGKPYTPLNDTALDSLDHWLEIFKTQQFYRPVGKKIYLYNLPKLTNRINVEMIVGVADLSDQDELPIPAGEEANAIQMCVEFIIGERQLPADHKTDTRDIN